MVYDWRIDASPRIPNIKFAHLKCDVVIPDANFQLLFPDDVLFRGVGIVFPVHGSILKMETTAK